MTLLEQYTRWFMATFMNKPDYERLMVFEEVWSVLFSLIAIAVVIAIICGIYLGVYNLVDKARGRFSWEDGVIIDKQYIGERNTIGTGLGLDAQSQLTVMSTTSHEDEKFLIFVDTKNTGIHKIETSIDYYYHSNIGDKKKLELFIGWLSNSILKVKILTILIMLMPLMAGAQIHIKPDSASRYLLSSVSSRNILIGKDPTYDTVIGVLVYYIPPLPSSLLVDSAMGIRKDWHFLKIFLLRNKQEIPLSNQFIFTTK